MAFTDKEITIKFTVDSTGAVKGIAGVDDALKNTESTSTTLNQSLELLKKGYNALEFAAGALISAISQGDKINDVSEAFARLSAQAGSTSDVFLKQLNTATAETVDNFTLMKSANDALKANLTPEQFTTVAEAARLFANESGSDLAQELEASTRALASGRDAYFKLKGVVIDTAQAYADFKTKYKISGELNEQGQILAKQEALLEATREKLQAAGEQAIGTGDALDQLSKALKDAYAQFVSQIEKSDVLGESLKSLKESIKQIDARKFADDVAQIAASFVGVISNVAELIKKFDSLKLGFKVYQEAQRLQSEAGGLFNPFKAAFSSDFSKGLKAQRDFYKEAEENIARQEFALQKNKEAQLALNGATEDYTALEAELERQANAGAERRRAHAQDLIDHQATQKKNEEALNKERERAAKLLDDELDSLEKQLDTQAAIGEEARQQRVALLKDIGSSIASGLPSIFSGDFRGGSGQIGGGLGQLAGQKIGESLGDSLQESFGESFSQAGEVLGPIGATLGNMAGEAIGKGLVDAFSHVFGGGKNEETKARKQVDRWLSEIFDKEKLRVIIGGNLTDAFDFDFGGSKGFNAPDWSALFSELPTDAQRAFDAVGISIKGLQGISEDVAGQIAFVFSQNLGGSLNNLQIALGTLGLTAEQMGAQVISAFERGEISALQAQSALLGIQQVAQVGIPDGIGMVAEAFDHLTAAGAKGGRVTLDGLVDIAAEAKELGINTIPELQAKFQEFVAVGKVSQEQVTEFFDALAQNSIGNVDALLNASKDTLIAISSSLQQSGLLKEIEGVVQAILQLPDEKTVRVNVETRFTGDKAAADAIGLGNSVGSSPGVA